MQPASPRPDHDLVLAQAPYVRALAQRLVFDGQLAEDLAQDVLLAALAHAPSDPRSLKGWLATVVRHLAARAFRGQARRRNREQASAREVASVPTPQEILAREDLRRWLVEHVLALDEAVRSVMILRFLEELPPREVARRLALPVETVRTRTQRGLDVLRSRLDRERSQGRGAWSLALVVGLRIEPPSLLSAAAAVLFPGLPGVLAMSLPKKLALVLTLALLASTALLRLEWGADASGAEEPLAAEIGPSVASVEELAPLVLAAAVDEGRSAVETAAAPGGLAEDAPTTGSLLLEVRWHDGTPAAGVGARIESTGFAGPPADAFDVLVGADGMRWIEQLPPGRVTIQVDRGPLESCRVVPGERAVVALTLRRGFDLSGRVVGPEGVPIAGAEILLDQMGGGWDGFVVARTEEDGSFLVRSVKEGMAWVSARAALHAPSVQHQLIGGPVDIDGVEIVLERTGASLAGVVLGADGRPVPRARVLVGSEDSFRTIRLDGGAFGRPPAAQCVSSGDDGSFALVGVPIGRLEIQARCPGHAPWQGAVETEPERAAHVTMRLFLGATLSGRVADRFGSPLANTEIHANGDAGFTSSSTRSVADGSFEMRDLPAGDFEASAEAEGYGRAETVLRGMPGGELVWNPVLDPGLAIRGRLVASEGDLSRWWIRCESQDWSRSELRSTAIPAADGSFDFRGCADVQHRLEVHAPESSYPVVRLDDVRPGPQELVIRIEPSSLPSCRLRGRIVDPSGQPMPGIGLWLVSEGYNVAPLLHADAEGAFEAGPLPPGKYSVHVRADGFVALCSEPIELLARAVRDLGELRLERGGTIAARLLGNTILAGDAAELLAEPLAGGRPSRLLLHGDEARSESLTAGEYRVSLQARDGSAALAQRSVQAIVRAGETTRIELRAEAGVAISIELAPADVEEVRIELQDSAGIALWEGSAVRSARLILPPAATHLVAIDARGRRASVPVRGLATDASLRVEVR